MLSSPLLESILWSRPPTVLPFTNLDSSLSRPIQWETTEQAGLDSECPDRSLNHKRQSGDIQRGQEIIRHHTPSSG